MSLQMRASAARAGVSGDGGHAEIFQHSEIGGEVVQLKDKAEATSPQDGDAAAVVGFPNVAGDVESTEEKRADDEGPGGEVEDFKLRVVLVELAVFEHDE